MTMEPTISTKNSHGLFATTARVHARLMTWTKPELVAKVLRVYDGHDDETVTKKYWNTYSKAELACIVGDAYGAEF